MLRRYACVMCALFLALAGCAGMPHAQEPGEAETSTQESTEQEPAAIERKALGDYSWEELSRISAQMNEAGMDGARAVAAQYGLVEEDGSLTRQTKQVVLAGNRAIDVRLAGIMHDDLADGSGRAGLCFMTVGALEIRPMNDVATVEGGWEASGLRAWLATEGKAMLPEDLASAIVPVNKLTNNAGLTQDPASVTVTADELWLFSPREVCGDVLWDADEYRGKRGDYNIDAILNAEGNQYEAFAREGVTATSDPNHFLSLEQSTGPSPWWYRSPFPFEWLGYGPTGSSGYFYQVRASGYPESLGSPEVPAAVVVGFGV